VGGPCLGAGCRGHGGFGGRGSCRRASRRAGFAQTIRELVGGDRVDAGAGYPARRGPDVERGRLPRTQPGWLQRAIPSMVWFDPGADAVCGTPPVRQRGHCRGAGVGGVRGTGDGRSVGSAGPVPEVPTRTSGQARVLLPREGQPRAQCASRRPCRTGLLCNRARTGASHCSRHRQELVRAVHGRERLAAERVDSVLSRRCHSPDRASGPIAPPRPWPWLAARAAVRRC
jgi:hypothetical protein